MRNMKTVGIAAAVLAGAALTALNLQLVQAQSGSRAPTGGYGGQVRSSQSGTAQRRSAAEPFEVRFWNWLQSVQYRNWSPLPGQTAGAIPGESPHGAQLKIYVNRTAAADPQKLPEGSVLVKESYSQDGGTLMAVTVMYRSKGYDPEHGDWYWAKYEPDGRVSRIEGMAVAGRVQMCADCHSSAAGGDFAFANDR